MIVAQAITRAFLHAQGKATPPAKGTPKYNALLAIADSMQKLWATEPDVEWDSLYDRVTLANAIGTSDSVAIDSTIQYISKREDDHVTIGGRDFSLVKPNQLHRYQYTDVCAQTGRVLKFPAAFDASSVLIGSAVEVPAILYTSDITDGTNIVEVDDPMWLVYMMAAEFARNNIIKAPQYDNIVAYAEQAMQKMKQNNAGQMDEVPMGSWITGETWK